MVRYEQAAFEEWLKQNLPEVHKTKTTPCGYPHYSGLKRKRGQ